MRASLLTLLPDLVSISVPRQQLSSWPFVHPLSSCLYPILSPLPQLIALGLLVLVSLSAPDPLFGYLIALCFFQLTHCRPLENVSLLSLLTCSSHHRSQRSGCRSVGPEAAANMKLEASSRVIELMR